MNCHYTTLPDEGLLLLEGPDAMIFLQGQTSCDTRKVSLTQGINGTCCNVQGRMVCDFFLFQYGTDKFALRMHKDLIQSSAAHFGKYIVFSKASLKPGDNQCGVAALWGSDSKAALADISAAPSAQFETLTTGGVTVAQVDSAGKQFELYLSHDISPQWSALLSSASSASADQWQLLQINGGRARLSAATASELLPQMLNYDITGHVDFKKGCYTGQEIIARLHYRGKAKRRLYRAKIEENVSAIAGTRLFIASSEQAAGMVINSAPDDSGNTHLLCTVNTRSADDTLHLGDNSGPMLSPLPLPEALVPSQ